MMNKISIPKSLGFYASFYYRKDGSGCLCIYQGNESDKLQEIYLSLEEAKKLSEWLKEAVK
jgi:hypothetical protein